MTVSAPLAIAAEQLSAGAYLRLRREAADVSIQAVAQICASSPVALSAAIAALNEAEQDRATLDQADLYRMVQAFPFVPVVYLALAQGIPAGDICRQCGCTWDDACIEGHGFGCAWADSTKTLCTACKAKAA